MNKCCSTKTLLIFFTAVADKHRQHILGLINKSKSMNASEIIRKIHLSQPTVSHHLTILKNAGLLSAKKKGKEVFYSIQKKTISACCLDLIQKLTK